jgi:uncharacterized OsmC-like protein
MATQEIAAALERAESVFQRKPQAAFHEDAPGTVRWQGGLRFTASHPNGKEVATDMPGEFGGTGDQVSPGWMVRAGLASCTATCIAMAAARAGIELGLLEVQATSSSDARGMLGMAGEQGGRVYAGPHGVALQVRIAAAGVAPQRLRELVEEASRRAPMTAAFKTELPVALRIEVEGG